MSASSLVVHLASSSTIRTGAAIVVPGAPTTLSAAVSGQVVVLSWAASTSGSVPSSFVLEAGSASGRTHLANADTGSSQPTLTASSVPSGTYFVRVRARNESGTSEPSNEIVVTVGGAGCTGVPNPPAGFSASASGSNVTLAWQMPASGCAPTQYQIEAGSGPGLSNLANVSTGSAATTFAASGVGDGTYYARVRSVTVGGTSVPSNEVQFSVASASCSGPPVAPTRLAVSVSGTTMALTWTAISNIPPTSYVIEAGSASGRSDIVVSDTGNTATSLTATAAPGTYFVRVRGKNLCGTSAASNEVQVTVAGTGEGPVITAVDKSSAQPFALLTVTGSGFDPAATLLVQFSNDQGFSSFVPPTAATTTAIQVSVPMLVSTNGSATSGAVSVRVLLVTPAGRITSNVFPGFQIQDLPTAASAPGVLTLNYLTAASMFAANTLPSRATGTSLGAPFMNVALGNQVGNLNALIGHVRTVVENPSQSFVFGSVSGTPLTITSATLANVDRMLLGVLAAQASGAVAPASASPFLAAATSSTCQAQEAKVAGDEYLTIPNSHPSVGGVVGYYKASIASSNCSTPAAVNTAVGTVLGAGWFAAGAIALTLGVGVAALPAAAFALFTATVGSAAVVITVGAVFNQKDSQAVQTVQGGFERMQRLAEPLFVNPALGAVFLKTAPDPEPSGGFVSSLNSARSVSNATVTVPPLRSPSPLPIPVLTPGQTPRCECPPGPEPGVPPNPGCTIMCPF